MARLSSNYVRGLVDGEGSFTVYIPNPDKKKNALRLAVMCIGARPVREIRTPGGNVNSEFPEDNRPSLQASRECPKCQFIWF